MAKCIGIDLGTTNSCISYIEGKEMQVVPSAEGSRVIPSLTAISPEGKRIFGHAAKRQLVTHAQNTIWGIKRLMGRKYQTEEVREFKKRIGYMLVEAENGDIKVRLQDKLYSPEEISGFFLGYLKNAAEEFFAEPVTDAVITVPAFFNDAQRQATRVAGEIAGMNVIRIINEPTAALLAYGSRIRQDGFYAVYDLGGGTFDVSIVEVNGEVFKVVSSLGDTFLGGSDFDARVVNWIFEEVEKEIHHDLRDSLEIVQRVVQVAEKAKIELSFQPETKVSLPYLSTAADGSPYHFERSMQRTQLEEFTSDLIERTMELIGRALDEINVNRSRVLEAILVGGQSRMPAIFQRMSDFFQKPPVVDLNPEEVVAQGAALQAEIIKGKVKDIVLLDVTPLTLGVETIGDSFTKIIERNSTIPIKKSMIFTTVTDNQTTVKIHVIQGERELASQNKSLGYFNLVGIPIMPKGMPQIDVTFEIDANGIVKVSAQDRSTGLLQSMKVQPASGLNPEEIERIIREAQQYNEEDRRQLHFKKIASQLQEELDTAKYYYNRYIDKLNPHEGAEIDSLISRSQEVLQGDNVVAIEELHKKMKSFRILINNILTEELSH